MKATRIAQRVLKTSLRSALKDEIQSGDVILIKGSRGMKMEEEVEYEMGGNLYKKPKVQNNILLNKQKEFMNQVKIIFNKLLQEE